MSILFDLLATIVSDHPNTDDNLSDPENIMDFADVCGYTITLEAAEMIAKTGRAWMSDAYQRDDESCLSKEQAIELLDRYEDDHQKCVNVSRWGS